MQLVVTEKPSVAASYAQVLGATERKEGYFEGNGYRVSWCIGHLVEAATPQQYREEWKAWKFDTLPIFPKEWKYNVKEATAEQYRVLEQLMNAKEVSTVICATDAGREGELIFRLVYEMTGCRKEVKRLWLSSMEESAIRAGFENLKPGSDYDFLYEAALCRQKADWLVGINASRLFTLLEEKQVVRVGRVRTPTLALLVHREEEIKTFNKETYYTVHISKDGLEGISARLEHREKAEQIAAACDGKEAVVLSEKWEEKKVPPPKLYDLTALQRDANQTFGFTAKQTLDYVQSLYEKKLCTYPRTDSRYLTEDMAGMVGELIPVILDTVPFRSGDFYEPKLKGILNSKKVTDHHAIIPTPEMAKRDLSEVPEGERKILYLIAERLLCATEQPCRYQQCRMELLCEESIFQVTYRQVLEEGWKEAWKAFAKYYHLTKDTSEEVNEPLQVGEGEVIGQVRAVVKEQETTPPKHFTESSLLAAMEHAGKQEFDPQAERTGLGTPATRADIIEMLVKEGMVKREQGKMLPTPEGIRLIGVLPEKLTSPSLTAEWENTLALISRGKAEGSRFLENIESLLVQLVRSYGEVWKERKKHQSGRSNAGVLGKCPNCGSEVKSGIYGAYCSGKCGMNVSRIFGATLTDSQTKDLLAGKKIFMKGLKGKKGTFDAFLVPDGIEEYRCQKNGQTKTGMQFKVRLEFVRTKQKK